VQEAGQTLCQQWHYNIDRWMQGARDDADEEAGLHGPEVGAGERDDTARAAP
jgi:hypothetical protein